jgi:pimeloyl-ACP methyl ester carboxylesterase
MLTMLDERAFIARVEAAGSDEFARLLANPTAEEEEALRSHLGDERYRRMRGLALRRAATRGALGSEDRPNVVVIHGIMGGELTAFTRSGTGEQIWVHLPRLVAGRLRSLKLAEDGLGDADLNVDVRPTGIMKRFYGELLLALSLAANVRAFWFDWRKDLAVAADALAAQITGWFGNDAPVHLVAHSMGGLVARTFIKNHPRRWATMWDGENGRRGGRLVMLGTPNHGSFAVLQVITGLEATVRKLALLDFRHSTRELQDILSSFVGLYQMLPSPLALAGEECKTIERLYQAATYGELNVPQRHLSRALEHHKQLQDAVDPQRMIYVAGCHQPTPSGLKPLGKKPLEVLLALESYETTLDGDGRVPHRLGLLKDVPTFYVEESHGALAYNRRILDALVELLTRGETAALPKTVPARRRGEASRELLRGVREEAEKQERRDEARIMAFVRRIETTRGVRPDTVSAEVGDASRPILREISIDERVLEEIVARPFLGDAHDEDLADLPAGPRLKEPAHIEIGLVHGGIEETDTLAVPGDDAIDALAVGHYLGVKPLSAELALDRAVSRALRSLAPEGEVPESELLLTQYAQRGTLRGELGQPFFLHDPRDPEHRVIVIAGMGVPGRFGVPELTVLVRELVWSLGHLGKGHLATVLIGAGVGNLSVSQAVSAWIRGIKHAVTGVSTKEELRLCRVTFVEFDPNRVLDIHEAILAEKAPLEKRGRMTIDYQPLTEAQLDELEKAIQKREEELLEKARRERARWRRAGFSLDQAQDRPTPTRLTLSLERGSYRFGAITSEAAVPEREIAIDPALVTTANDELMAEWDLARQHERGHFLERLLLPDDLRPLLATNAPLVLMLDANTARIHWEMLAQPPLSGDGSGGQELHRSFLGTSRGFTRQLRTTFSPPPEPPPPPRRILRVLVVADPAADQPLPGAEEEGVEIADLFESFNAVYENDTENRVEVVRLLGPREATRTNVLRHLLLRHYDVLHFAGHCVYDMDQPSHSGWIFTGNERITAHEMRRVDRIPKFIFSNACESGITPDRAAERSDALAPSFAEAFFERGVANFVCTAWPVDDLAALTFARTLYGRLLGLSYDEARVRFALKSRTQLMYEAMHEARLATLGTLHGRRTWGAYQHYGNPYFQFFDMPAPRQEPAATSRDTPDEDKR